MTGKKIILCSASPRRLQLLKELGIEFEIQVKEVDETFPAKLKAEEVAVYLSEKKANEFSGNAEKDVVRLTADTIVWLNDEVLGKPVDAKDAFNILKKLSGKKHQVYTAVCFSQAENRNTIWVKSDVQFKNLSSEEIEYYINHFKPFDKAGSYGAQECLPEGLDPCSEVEKNFLRSINKPDLFKKTMQKKNFVHMPIIDHIEGSYFNVMGLPVVEVYRELDKLKFINH